MDHSKRAIYPALALVAAVLIVWLAIHYQNAPLAPSAATSTASTMGKHLIAWKFTDKGSDQNGTPHTAVTAAIDNASYEIGTYPGSCREINGGGIDGKGLLEGEVSGAQCWFAGGGDEVGIFVENGIFVIKHGELGEPQPSDNVAAFRGNFQTIATAGSAR